MALFVALFIASLPVLVARIYWRKLPHSSESDSDEQQLFWRWVWLGAVTPTVLWILFNLGIVGPPVWPTVLPMSAGLKAWHNSFSTFSFVSTLIISSYWAGITFAWLLGRVFNNVRSHRDFMMLCGAWGVLLVPLGAILLFVGRSWMIGLTLFLCCLPLVHMSLNLKPEKRPTPTYSRALARISFGKYDEAEAEVIRELEQWEEDFDGWMMLAELYATRFDDLAGAHQTVQDLCAQPATTPVQVSIAMNRLADWHLKFGRDPASARTVLEVICTRFPGTHLERMARQRIHQLPGTRQELEEKSAGKPLHLPHVADELEAPAYCPLSREQALAEANEFVEALKKNPDDVAAREEFARVLAENLGDADTAIDQLRLLLAMPDQAVDKRAGWLLTIAAWHARHRNDVDMALLVYQEVMRDFASTTHAFAAQRRVYMLTLQMRIRRRALSA